MSERYQQLFKTCYNNLVIEDNGGLSFPKTTNKLNNILKYIKINVNEKFTELIDIVIETFELMEIIIVNNLVTLHTEIATLKDSVHTQLYKVEKINEELRNSNEDNVKLKESLSQFYDERMKYEYICKMHHKDSDNEIIKLTDELHSCRDAYTKLQLENDKITKTNHELQVYNDELIKLNNQQQETNVQQDIEYNCIMSQNGAECPLCINYKSTESKSINDYCIKECKKCIGYNDALIKDSKMQGAEEFYGTKSKALLNEEIQAYGLPNPKNPKYVNNRDKFITIMLECSLLYDGPDEINLRNQLFENFCKLKTDSTGPVAFAYTIYKDHHILRLIGIVRYKKTKDTKVSTKQSIFANANIIYHTISNVKNKRLCHASVISAKWDRTWKGYHTLLDDVVKSYTNIVQNGVVIGDTLDKFTN